MLPQGADSEKALLPATAVVLGKEPLAPLPGGQNDHSKTYRQVACGNENTEATTGFAGTFLVELMLEKSVADKAYSEDFNHGAKLA